MRDRTLPTVLLIYFCSTAHLSLSVADELSPLEPVALVDLERYQGVWYEIERLPNRFQKHCSRNVTAEYRRLEEGGVAVTNRCLDESGMSDEASGVARVVDTASNAVLEVSFVSLFGWQIFWGDYWIIGLGKAYDYAVIGTPDREYGWILSRTPTLSLDQQEQIRQLLSSNGYDPDRFIPTSQD